MTEANIHILPLLYIADISCLMDHSIIHSNLYRVSEKRRDTIRRYHFIREQALSLGAGLLLEEGLLRMGYKVKDLGPQIQYNAFGKPYLAGQNFYFNLSHSSQMIMGIFARNEVGCDIEQIADADPDIVDGLFSPWEKALYYGTSPSNRDETFYRIWTMREGFLKTIGRGLADPVPEFSTVSADGFYVPTLMYKQRLFWGQSGLYGGYAYAWWAETKVR